MDGTVGGRVSEKGKKKMVIYKIKFKKKMFLLQPPKQMFHLIFHLKVITFIYSQTSNLKSISESIKHVSEPHGLNMLN